MIPMPPVAADFGWQAACRHPTDSLRQPSRSRCIKGYDAFLRWLFTLIFLGASACGGRIGVSQSGDAAGGSPALGGVAGTYGSTTRIASGGTAGPVVGGSTATSGGLSHSGGTGTSVLTWSGFGGSGGTETSVETTLNDGGSTSPDGGPSTITAITVGDYGIDACWLNTRTGNQWLHHLLGRQRQRPSQTTRRHVQTSRRWN